jgi:hypothetical protein
MTRKPNGNEYQSEQFKDGLGTLRHFNALTRDSTRLGKISCYLGRHKWEPHDVYESKNFENLTQKVTHIKLCKRCPKDKIFSSETIQIEKPKYKIGLVLNEGLWFDFTRDVDAENVTVLPYDKLPEGYVESLMNKYKIPREKILIVKRKNEMTLAESAKYLLPYLNIIEDGAFFFK